MTIFHAMPTAMCIKHSICRQSWLRRCFLRQALGQNFCTEDLILRFDLNCESLAHCVSHQITWSLLSNLREPSDCCNNWYKNVPLSFTSCIFYAMSVIKAHAFVGCGQLDFWPTRWAHPCSHIATLFYKTWLTLAKACFLDSWSQTNIWFR